MFNTFNMGVGMIIVIKHDDIATALSILKSNDIEAYTIGEVISGSSGVMLV
jgi:phosphoribosylformylglycinamidine cyclo-ligase